MTQDDLQPFGERLVGLAEVFDAKLSEAKILAYFEALSLLDLDVAQAAIRAAVRACKFFPRPAELFSLAVGDDEDAAEVAWMALRSAMSRAGGYASVVTADPVLGETILAVFESWPGACELDLSPEMWASKRKEFGRVYRVCRSRGLTGSRYLRGIVEQKNAGRPDWMKFVSVYRLDGVTVQPLTLEAGEQARQQISAAAGFERVTAASLPILAQIVREHSA